MLQVCSALGISESELRKNILTPDTYDVPEFKLYQRALHVVEEARRVQDWLSASSVESLGR